MGYVNQIHLLKKGVKKNRKFLELLYNEQGFIGNKKRGVYKTFEIELSEGIHTRKADPNMTLKKFIKLINSRININLNIGSPDLYLIEYSALELKGGGSNGLDRDRFVFIGCPYNYNNLNIISKLYQESFGCKFEDEPVEEHIRQQHHGQFIDDIKCGYLDESREDRS